MAASSSSVHVLVVDDEEPMRRLARRILEPAGYHLTEASNGPAAIAQLASGAPLDLLIADLEMPELPGEEMVRQIRTTRRDLKVLYVSGVVDRLLDARPVLWEGEAFLDKPYSPQGLLEAVALLLYGSLKKPVP